MRNSFAFNCGFYLERKSYGPLILYGPQIDNLPNTFFIFPPKMHYFFGKWLTLLKTTCKSGLNKTKLTNFPVVEVC